MKQMHTNSVNSAICGLITLWSTEMSLSKTSEEKQTYPEKEFGKHGNACVIIQSIAFL